MPNINEMRDSKYVSQNDVDPAVVVTIAKITKEDVSLESEPADEKWTAHFKENIKPLVLNWTNINLIAVVIGSQNTDNWIGKEIVLWRDKNVMFKGELKGGIRVRAAINQPPAPGTMTPEEQASYDKAAGFAAKHKLSSEPTVQEEARQVFGQPVPTDDEAAPTDNVPI